jgi:hypothetical protein
MGKAKKAEVLPPVVEESAESLKDLLSEGAMIVKLTNDTQQAMAVAHPRDKMHVKEMAIEELNMMPELAVQNYYSITYKNSPKPVEGASIRAAQNLRQVWGHCTAHVQADPAWENDESIYITGTFIDFQSNVSCSRPFRISKWRKEHGKMVKLGGAQLEQAFQAGVSKCERNVIFDGLPAWLVQTYYNESRRLAALDTKRDPDKMLKAYAALGVTKEQLEAYTGCELSKMEDGQWADLRGLYNSLRDGERKVADVFTAEPKEPERPASSVEEILGAGAELEEEEIKAPEKSSVPGEGPDMFE